MAAEDDLVRLFEVIDEHFALPLDEWQRFVLEQLYKNGAPLQPFRPRPRLMWSTTGPIQRGPVGAPPSYFFIVDELADSLPPDQITEARQRLIDAISDDVEAKIARTQCPKFPHTDA